VGQGRYAERGRPSIEPVVIKLQLIIFEGIRSERRLIETATDGIWVTPSMRACRITEVADWGRLRRT
jgi:hypothetical protein